MTDDPTPDEAEAEEVSEAMFHVLPEGIDFVATVEWHSERGVQLVVWPMRLRPSRQDRARSHRSDH